MTPVEPSEILFMGLGKSSVLWYRCALPAQHLGADWVGVRGEPPGVQVLTGLVRGDTRLPNYDDYRVIVLQQPHGTAWLRQIRSLRERGITVLYEVDDYLHGVAKQPYHDYAKHFTKQRLRAHEMCMRACDGLIVSTDYIGRRYARFNRNVYVCRNGLDLARYQLTRPERPTINVGWAGASGHMAALMPWLNALIEVMRDRADVCFISIGEPGLAAAIDTALDARGRALGIPFCALETYPSAMCTFDIALAPAGHTSWYRGKSDLRWLEASALAIPTIADPVIYPEIEPGVTGYQAATAREMTDALTLLLDDAQLRERVGRQAQEYVRTVRSSADAAMQWHEVCVAASGGYQSLNALPRTTERQHHG